MMTTVPTPAIDAIEQFSAARSTHPRVSKADIEAAIAHVFYGTADALIDDELDDAPQPEIERVTQTMGIFTICIIFLKNGWMSIGYSAPASPENFDAEKGCALAYDKAFQDLWPLMGFALRDRLHRDSDAAIEPDLVRDQRESNIGGATEHEATAQQTGGVLGDLSGGQQLT